MPTDYRSMYEKDYLGAWDFTEGDKTLTIKKAQRGELTGSGGRKTKKPVVYFQETEKGLALNATNGKTIATLYGPMVEDWAGKKITLYASRTTMGSEEVDCVRIRPQAPKGNGAAAFAGDDEPTITPDQTAELEQLCVEGGRDLTAEFLKMGAIERLSDLPAKVYGKSKTWISRQRLTEHQGSQP